MRIPLSKERQHAVLRVKLRKPPAEEKHNQSTKKKTNLVTAAVLKESQQKYKKLSHMHI